MKETSWADFEGRGAAMVAAGHDAFLRYLSGGWGFREGDVVVTRFKRRWFPGGAAFNARVKFRSRSEVLDVEGTVTKANEVSVQGMTLLGSGGYILTRVGFKGLSDVRETFRSVLSMMGISVPEGDSEGGLPFCYGMFVMEDRLTLSSCSDVKAAERGALLKASRRGMLVERLAKGRYSMNLTMTVSGTSFVISCKSVCDWDGAESVSVSVRNYADGSCEEVSPGTGAVREALLHVAALQRTRGMVSGVR